MAKKKRPGVKAAPSVRSADGFNTSRHGGLRGGMSTRSGMGMSTRSGMSGMSTRSGLSGKSSHHGSRSVASKDKDDWDEKSAVGSVAGKSMRSLYKTANSVSSGLGLSTHSGGLTHKQKKARPGLAVMPQGMSTRPPPRRGFERGMSNGSGLSSNSGHGDSRHKMKKQMSMRSMDSGKRSLHSQHSKRSLHSKKSLHSQKSKRGGLSKSGHSTRTGMTSAPAGSSHSRRSRGVPQPPDGGSYYSDEDEYEEDMEDYDEFEEDEEEEEHMVMPQTEEEIRKGLHTEQVTKGFFRKKHRSIKWYSADIDKVDAGNYEPGETIEEEEEASEYESSTDSEEENVIPDPWYVALGRGLLLLEKKGEETTPIKRWLRCLTWTTFVCDATAAIVSLVQFQGVADCCGKPILNLGGININWPTVIRYATIFYLILILLEVYPVLRRGFPFNIVNPMIGFLITFALFFDDSYFEALAMWCIETCAVLSEFAVYRVKIRQVNMRAVEIKKLMPKTTKKKDNFEDEDTYLKELHKARRRYYVLKQEQRMDQRLLQYLHVAVYMNIVMSSIVLMLILVIARNGGLCIENWDYPNPFASNQLARCTHCTDPTLECQYCDDLTETYQCYFPYS